MKKVRSNYYAIPGQPDPHFKFRLRLEQELERADEALKIKSKPKPWWVRLFKLR